jgi:hypothetical protein
MAIRVLPALQRAMVLLATSRTWSAGKPSGRHDAFVEEKEAVSATAARKRPRPAFPESALIDRREIWRRSILRVQGTFEILVLCWRSPVRVDQKDSRPMFALIEFDPIARTELRRMTVAVADGKECDRCRDKR